MPRTLPPATLPGSPIRHILPAGTALWRVHRSGQPAQEFESPRLTNGFGGGRFDSVGYGGYPFLYGSPESGTALAERFVRDLDFSVTANRRLPRKSLECRSASVVRTSMDLTLLRLMSGPDLAAIGQDDWLLTARGTDFDLTRRWAAWLRERAPWAHGIVWQSSVDLPKPTMVLFGDTCGPFALEHEYSMTERLDNPDREGWLQHQLSPHGVELYPPSPSEKPKVFINYRSDNGGLAATLLDQELGRRLGSAAVFLDRRSIVPGADFSLEILDKVRSCTVLLVVVGPGWEHAGLADGTRRLDDAEDWVRKEIREAADYQVSVVPVVVGARSRLEEDALPADIRILVRDQYLHLPDGFGRAHVSLLVDQLLERFHGLAA